MEVDNSDNSEVYVVYISENGTQEQVYSAIQTIDASELEEYKHNYIIEEIPEASTSVETATDQNLLVQVKTEPEFNREKWLDEETRRLLVFYIDNKEAFTKGAAHKKHLWSVACKTILNAKTPDVCEIKLHNLKRTFSVIRAEQAKGNTTIHEWQFFDLCQQAFHNDSYTNMLLNDAIQKNLPKPVTLPRLAPLPKNNSGIVQLKKQTVFKAKDAKVEQILNLYLKYSKGKGMSQKIIWELIGNSVGDDPDSCRKRFLNFKQHYIRILEKRNETGNNEGSNWPYLKLFEQIFAGDVDFQKKHGLVTEKRTRFRNLYPNNVASESSWNDTELMVLVKYCFDCFDEFQDPSIPNDFLWAEVGRLLFKSPDMSKKKYEALKNNHLDMYISGNYDHINRKAISIIFDNLITKETEVILTKCVKMPTKIEKWSEAKIDEMVQFFFNNLVLFKDRQFYFVCWAAVRRKLNKSFHACYYQWLELTTLYRSLLEVYRNDDVEIDWKYIEIFDRIFDYGIDTKLLEGFDIALNIVEEQNDEEEASDSEEFDEKTHTKKGRGAADPKQLKILEFYLKNKDTFDSSHHRKKVEVWAPLARQISLTTKDCAHRFRNLKQVYMVYVQREIDKPEMPILWPYYALCKKVFGYRVVKNKLRNSKADVNAIEEWTPKDIKQIISYFSQHFESINKEPDNVGIWTDLATQINKSKTSCRDKFLELRKSYRKVRSSQEKNPDAKVNWKYYKAFDCLYSGREIAEQMDVDSDGETMDVKEERLDDFDDEEYQCIIVLPDGEDISKLHSVFETTSQPKSRKKPKTVWTKAERLRLIKSYLEYVEPRQGKIINTKEMWTELSNILNKNKLKCRRVYFALKKQHNTHKTDRVYKRREMYRLFEKILSCKLKFFRPQPTIDDIQLPTHKPFRNYVLPLWKVEEALKFYLDHLEEFHSPQYEEKYLWNAMSKTVSAPLSKLYEKIHYLKVNYDVSTGQVDGENVSFGHLIQEIYEKEFALKIAMSGILPTSVKKSEKTTKFDDDEREILLNWYLENLDRFKNPMYVTSYLWKEASYLLQKTPLACSKEMAEIRNQYKKMVKNSSENLPEWRFYELCQKIYGTGKKSTPTEVTSIDTVETPSETVESLSETVESLSETGDTIIVTVETPSETTEFTTEEIKKMLSE